MMQIKCLTVGPLLANCYLVWCEETKEAVVIDPGAEGEKIVSEIEKEHLRVKYIINTHGHVDHISANREVKNRTGAKILIHADDAPLLTNPQLNLSSYLGAPVTGPPPDVLLCEGEEIEIGNNLKLEVIHTPGHTRGGICLLADKVVFTGDTLFAGSVGRTDFPGGSYTELLDSIKKKILTLGDDYVIYPGHGPASTVGEERRNNPFLF